jgi:hypothetical protein
VPEVPGMSSKLATDGRPLWRLWLADTSVWSRLESLAPFVCNKIQCEYATHCTIPILYTQGKLITWFCPRVGRLVAANVIMM